MAAYYPPTNFFQNINFNNDFYAIPNNNQGITLSYANTHYLFSTGVATSTAISTLFSGSVGIGTIGGNAGTLDAARGSLPGGEHLHWWAGSTPPTFAALRPGTQMGSDSPGQH